MAIFRNHSFSPCFETEGAEPSFHTFFFKWSLLPLQFLLVAGQKGWLPSFCYRFTLFHIQHFTTTLCKAKKEHWVSTRMCIIPMRNADVPIQPPHLYTIREIHSINTIGHINVIITTSGISWTFFLIFFLMELTQEMVLTCSLWCPYHFMEVGGFILYMAMPINLPCLFTDNLLCCSAFCIGIIIAKKNWYNFCNLSLGIHLFKWSRTD